LKNQYTKSDIERYINLVKNKPFFSKNYRNPIEVLNKWIKSFGIIIPYELSLAIIGTNITLSEELKKQFINSDYRILENLVNPSEELYIAALSQNIDLIKTINNPTEEMMLFAIKKSPDFYNLFKTSNESFNHKAIENNPLVIKHISSPTNKMILTALSRDIKSIEYIKNPPPEVLIEIIKENINNIAYLLKYEELDPSLIKYLKKHINQINYESHKKLLSYPNTNAWGKMYKHIKNPSNEITKSFIWANRSNIQYVRFPSEELQLLAINRSRSSYSGSNSEYAKYIKHPTKYVQKKLIDESDYNIRYLNQADESIQLTAIKKDPHNIKYIKQPKTNIILEALNLKSDIIQYVAKPSKKIQIKALEIDLNNIRYIKNLHNEAIKYIQQNFSKLSDEGQLKLFVNNGVLLRIINPIKNDLLKSVIKQKPENIQYLLTQNEELQLIALENDDKYLSSTKHFKDSTEKVQLEILQKHKYGMSHIINPLPKIQEAYLNSDNWVFSFINNPTEETKIKAVTLNPWCIKDISNPSEEIQMIAIKQDVKYFKDIKSPTETVQIYAISKQPDLLKDIVYPSEKVQLVAITNKPDLILSIDNPSEILIFAALSNDSRLINNFKNLSVHMIAKLLKLNIHNYQFFNFEFLDDNNINTKNQDFDALKNRDWKYILFKSSYIILVKYIGVSKFILIPNSINGHPVKRIIKNTISNDDYVSFIKFSNGIEEIDDNIISNCSNLYGLFIPSGYLNISYPITPKSKARIYTDHKNKPHNWLISKSNEIDFNTIEVFYSDGYLYQESNLNEIIIWKYIGNVQKVIKLPISIEGKKIVSFYKEVFGMFKNKSIFFYVPKALDYLDIENSFDFLRIMIFSYSSINSSIFFESGNIHNNNLLLGSRSIYFNVKEIGENDDWQYCKHNNNEVSLVKFRFKSNSVSIPSYIDDSKVVALGSDLFQIPKESENNLAINSINLNQFIREIGSYCFSSCGNLEIVTLSPTLQHLGSHAFLNCGQLKSINIPPLLLEIKEETFSYCRMLSEVNLPNQIRVFGNRAFESTGFESISLPIELTQIGDYCFRDCINLAKINFGNKLENIGYYAFDLCLKLDTSNIPKKFLINDEILGNRKSCESCGKDISRLRNGSIFCPDCSFKKKINSMINIDTISTKSVDSFIFDAIKYESEKNGNIEYHWVFTESFGKWSIELEYKPQGYWSFKKIYSYTISKDEIAKYMIKIGTDFFKIYLSPKYKSPRLLRIKDRETLHFVLDRDSSFFSLDDTLYQGTYEECSNFQRRQSNLIVTAELPNDFKSKIYRLFNFLSKEYQ
jgi:hypothetical protein